MGVKRQLCFDEINIIITMVASTERMNVFKEHANGPLKIGPCVHVSFESCGTMAIFPAMVHALPYSECNTP